MFHSSFQEKWVEHQKSGKSTFVERLLIYRSIYLRRKIFSLVSFEQLVNLSVLFSKLFLMLSLKISNLSGDFKQNQAFFSWYVLSKTVQTQTTFFDRIYCIHTSCNETLVIHDITTCSFGFQISLHQSQTAPNFLTFGMSVMQVSQAWNLNMESPFRLGTTKDHSRSKRSQRCRNFFANDGWRPFFNA